MHVSTNASASAHPLIALLSLHAESHPVGAPLVGPGAYDPATQQRGAWAGVGSYGAVLAAMATYGPTQVVTSGGGTPSGVDYDTDQVLND